MRDQVNTVNTVLDTVWLVRELASFWVLLKHEFVFVCFSIYVLGSLEEFHASKIYQYIFLKKASSPARCLSIFTTKLQSHTSQNMGWLPGPSQRVYSKLLIWGEKCNYQLPLKVASLTPWHYFTFPSRVKVFVQQKNKQLFWTPLIMVMWSKQVSCIGCRMTSVI